MQAVGAFCSPVADGPTFNEETVLLTTHVALSRRRGSASVPALSSVAQGVAAMAAIAAAAIGPARAADAEFNWTTTLKQSAMFRAEERDPRLISGGSSATQDDGDRNFSKGLVSNRTDLLSEIDFKQDRLGFRVSGAVWFDPVYRRGNANDSPATSQGPANRFPEATADLHGRKIELLDAFVFGSFDLAGRSTTVRLGRHSLIYGESLFYGANGIAYAMAPVDVIKATSVPGTQFRELIRPVNQVSAQMALSRDVSFGAYYQLQWERTRLPASGSYLSTGDLLDSGGYQLQMIPPIPFVTASGWTANRTPDEKPGDGGQGGMQLKISVPAIGTEFGLYAVRYHERVPTIVLTDAAPTGLPGFLPQFLPSQYHLAFGRGARAYGASFSTGLGASSLAGELSLRDGAYLVADPVHGYAGNTLPRGRTLHGNLSLLTTYEPNLLATESSSAAEIACNTRLSVRNGQPIAANSTKSACALRLLYEPKYRQMASGLDLGVPVTASYTWGRSSAVPFFGPDRGGDVSVNFNFVYEDRWRVGLGFTHFYGPAGTTLDATGQAYSFKQSLADRDFVSLSLATTF